MSEGFANRHTAVLGGSGCDGRQAYLERLPDFLASMPGLRYEVELLVVDGSDVAAFYRMSGRWQGAAEFVLRGVQRLRVEDGLITHRTDYWDSAAFLSQVDDDAATALAALGLAGGGDATIDLDTGKSDEVVHHRLLDGAQMAAGGPLDTVDITGDEGSGDRSMSGA